MADTDITIAVIAKNEADRIDALLRSVAFAAEVIVVDSGSTDGTQAICRRYGARVIETHWRGYAGQKQFAMEQASSQWVLNLDADEAVSEALAAEVQTAVKRAVSETAAFSMPRLSKYLGRWIRHGGWYPDRKIRLIRKGAGRWEGEGLHEALVVSGKTARLSAPILHYVYRHIFDQVATINQFSEIYAAERKMAGPWYVIAGLGHALGKIFECYVWKRGILDGLPGLIIAVNSAFYVFLKHAKTWEQGLNKDGPVKNQIGDGKVKSSRCGAIKPAPEE
ncbi:MAG: glycosyltransferase family 2 protein [Thermodesulfobacteriota bacterium]|nr:glycosyltransferase family 2 protein [Thermodesulfobacteriota bacterium]